MLRDERGFVAAGPDLLRRTGGRPAGGSSTATRTTWRPACPACSSAGDVRAESAKRVASAVGEGAMAVMLVHRYLETVDEPARADVTAAAARRRAAHAVPVREATDEQLDWLCERGPGRAVRAGGPVYAEGDPADLLLRAARGHGRAVPPGRRRRRRDQPHRRSAACTPGPCRPTSGDRVPQIYNNSHAGHRAVAVLRAAAPTTFATIMQRVVPDGGAPAGGAVLRHAQNTQTIVGQRERLLALGLAVGRPDPRAEQPGRGRGAGHRRRCASGSPAMRHKLAHDRRRAGIDREPLHDLIELQERRRRAGRQGARR